MSEPLRHALKEWAVICRALAFGKQCLLLRKGGIAEPDGAFRLEATRFWLFPTYVHQQESGVRPDARPLLEETLAARPPAGTVRLEAWAEVTGVYRVRDLLPAQMLAHLHLWTDEAVAKRFQYRTPGLDVLTVRVWRAPQPVNVDDLPVYVGCKSWVPLEADLATEGSVPALSDGEYQDVVKQVETLLRPIAIV